MIGPPNFEHQHGPYDSDERLSDLGDTTVVLAHLLEMAATGCVRAWRDLMSTGQTLGGPGSSNLMQGVKRFGRYAQTSLFEETLRPAV